MQVFADLHIHSLFSMASSRMMLPGPVCAACGQKGLQVIGSGDALHPEWRRMWSGFDRTDQDILVVPTTEVEDSDRVHHLILAETFENFEELHERFLPHSRDIAKNGRPHIRLGGEAIAGMVHECGGLIGPAHAFTPWTSLFASFDRVPDCYGTERPDLLELGLSADSSYGAPVSDLAGIPFLSNSDAHSPDPAKLGREFNGLLITRMTQKAVLESISRQKIFMNAGFFPEEGKYSSTACVRCYTRYTASEAAGLGWKCPLDGGRIKKGVADRAAELADGPPAERPPYLHLIPLAEIIRTTYCISSPGTKKCREIYQRFIQAFGNEIAVLTRVPVPEIAEVDPAVASAIGSFRDKRVELFPGGGGKYGSFRLY
jgi:uncharacterized protein (TIGR00375 family)